MAEPNPDLAGGRLTIDLNALVSNWKYLSSLAGKAECAAVVKANAYGIGIEPAVTALAKAGCKTFFVALVEEGIRVKATAPSSRCFVLNGLFAGAEPHIIEHGLIPVLNSSLQAERWAKACKESGTALPCALQIDSGMSRAGMKPQELERVVSLPHIRDNLQVDLFMTHFACADDVGHPKTNVQQEVFEQASALLPGVARSVTNSAANLQATGFEYDLVRSGIALYGGEALNDVDNPMQVVATVEARIMQIQKARAGDSVGYGASETLTRDTIIAYVSVGYADGYHRAASNMGVGMRYVSAPANAAYKGTLVKGIGRISMDMCGFDVTDIDPATITEGDWIELFGPTISVDDVARSAGTIGYELLTGLGNRYARTYLGG